MTHIKRVSATNIVLVEDSLLFRDILRNACSTKLGYVVVGETSFGIDAVKIIQEVRPQIVILDLRLPDISGFDVVSHVRAFDPELKFLAMSGYCDDQTILQIERFCLHGFLDKDTSILADLGDALASINEGRTYFSATYLQGKAAQRADPLFFAKILSEREREVLSLIGQSMNDEEIAKVLCITLRTAQTHRSNILHKLNMPSTPKLISYAIEHGLGPRQGPNKPYFTAHETCRYL